MNREKFKKIKKAIRTVNPDMLIIGDLVNQNGKYFIDFVSDSHKFPNFESDSERDTIDDFYDYIDSHKLISDRIRRLRATGCQLPIMIVSLETGIIYNGEELDG